MTNAMEHLNWIKVNPNYIPEDGLTIVNSGGGSRTISYIESMTTLYLTEPWKSHPQGERLARQWHLSDIKYKEKLRKRTVELTNEALKDSPREYFVTIGFLDESKPIDLANIVKTIISYDWIIKFQAVLEFHTNKGVHPHVHMYLSCNLAKSKVIEKLFACKGIKKVCKGKNFIDVKVGIEEHKQYILGIKQESKIDYIISDRKFRDINGIPHLFEK